jgi:hypothetical protein
MEMETIVKAFVRQVNEVVSRDWHGICERRAEKNVRKAWNMTLRMRGEREKEVMKVCMHSHTPVYNSTVKLPMVVLIVAI